jgi:DNA repair protein RAD5
MLQDSPVSVDVFQAAYALDAQHRWGLTGTPVQNTLDDMFSLLHFLKG